VDFQIYLSTRKTNHRFDTDHLCSLEIGDFQSDLRDRVTARQLHNLHRRCELRVHFYRRQLYVLRHNMHTLNSFHDTSRIIRFSIMFEKTQHHHYHAPFLSSSFKTTTTQHIKSAPFYFGNNVVKCRSNLIFCKIWLTMITKTSITTALL